MLDISSNAECSNFFIDELIIRNLRVRVRVGVGVGVGPGPGPGSGPGPGPGSGPGAHGDINDVDASRGVDVGIPHESAGERRAAQVLPLEALEGGEELCSLGREERIVRVPGRVGDSMSTSLASG